MNFYHRDIDWVFAPEVDIDLCVDRTVRACRGQNSSLMVAQIFWEPYQVTPDLNTKLRYVVEQLNSAGINVIGLMHDSYGDLETIPWLDLVRVDWCLWKAWHNIIVNPVCGRNLQWNNSAKKFLFLTGKPYRRNRARLLWKLVNAGLESDMIWSFFCVGSDFEHTLDMLPELSREQVREFVDDYTRNPDNIELVIRNTGSMSVHYGGYPYDPLLFGNTLFRVISETSFRHVNEVPMIGQYPTEKFYITTLNYQPWIVAGDPGLVKHLEAQGYDGFNWAVSTPYDHVADMEARMNAIVFSTNDWIKSGIPDSDRVKKGVEHNARLTESKAQNLNAQLSALNQKHQLGFENLIDLFSIADKDDYDKRFHGFPAGYI